MVEQNLRRAQVKWGRLVKILGREVADRRMAGRFYVVVVKAVLLFGSETWVLTPWMEKALDDFHHWAVRRMAGMVPKHQQYGTWIYPPIGAELAMLELNEIGVYIARLQNMVAQYNATHPFMFLCILEEHHPGLKL